MQIATNVEKQGIEEVMRSCQELVEEFKRAGNRKGYKDIREEEWPSEDEEAADPHKEAEDPHQERRVSFAPEDEEMYSVLTVFGPRHGSFRRRRDRQRSFKRSTRSFH